MTNNTQIGLPGICDHVSAAVAKAFKIGMFQHADEIEPFAQWLVDYLKPHNVIEIGTLHGGTATLWHEICTGTVITIDLPDGQFGGADHHYDLDGCIERNNNLISQFPRIRPISGDSQSSWTIHIAEETFGGFSRQPVDFLFIDGNHSYEGVKADYQYYSPLVRPGGVIAFHDILDTPWHRETGCQVDKFWQELIFGLSESQYRAFSCNGPWGGIGAIVKP